MKGRGREATDYGEGEEGKIVTQFRPPSSPPPPPCYLCISPHAHSSPIRPLRSVCKKMFSTVRFFYFAIEEQVGFFYATRTLMDESAVSSLVGRIILWHCKN